MGKYRQCFYCEKPFTRLHVGEVSDSSTGVITRTKDHIIPRSKGGINSAINMVPCCSGCNKDKSALLPEEYLARIQYKLTFLKEGSYSHTHYSIIVKNVSSLIEKIQPFRHTLYKKGFPIVEVVTKTPLPGIKEPLKSPPSTAKKLKPQLASLLQFEKKYPYIYQLLFETNRDLPRWIVDNIGSNKLT